MAAVEPEPASEGPRGVRLRDAILALFLRSAQALRVTLNRGAAGETTRTLTRDSVRALASKTDRWPDLTSLETYALAAEWTFEEVVAELGRHADPRLRRDFAGLPRHRALLRSNLTSVEPGPLPILDGRPIAIPVAMDQTPPYVAGALTDLVFSGRPEQAWAVARASPAARFTARAGDCENAAYPRIPARAWLRVDARQTDVTPTDLFLIRHPFGLSVCGADAHGGALALVPDPASGYVATRFDRQDVEVLGRVVGMAAQVGRSRRPSPPGALEASEWQSGGGRSSHPGKQLLLEAWRRHARSYNAHGQEERRRRHVLGDKRGGQASGTLHSYLRTRDDHVPTPNFETFYRLAAAQDVDYQALLRAFDISPAVLADRGPAAGLDQPLPAIERLRAHRFGAYLEALGWDLPWLCALLAQVETGEVYHLGRLCPGWGPLLKPGAFVVVDRARCIVPSVSSPMRARAGPAHGVTGRTPACTNHGARGGCRPETEPSSGASAARRPAIERRDWERPMFLLAISNSAGGPAASSSPQFLCGYCERRGEIIRAVPHPGDDSHGAREFRLHEDVRVLGRVTHVATLL